MKTITIEIKHINKDNAKEIAIFAKKEGLKPFHSLSFQFSLIPEGIYEVETDHIFSNQYNTVGKDGKPGYRIFEYCKELQMRTCKELDRGYYIASGIKEIREYQKTVSVCHYCGKQYINTDLQFCNSCTGSQYLQEKDYHLLRLTNIHDKYSSKPLPEELIKTIKEAQKKANLEREAKNQADSLKRLENEIKDKMKDHRFRLKLYENYFTYGELNNLIHYSHKDTFTFGWRNKIADKEALRNRLNEIKGIEEFGNIEII